MRVQGEEHEGTSIPDTHPKEFVTEGVPLCVGTFHVTQGNIHTL
jgi:hypothetical protein